MKDIICMGEALIEFNEQNEGRYLFGFGGDTSNCAIAAARQGCETAYLTRIGNDNFGQKLINLWQQEKVITDYVDIDKNAKTGVYFVHHDENGHHFDYARKSSAAAMMTQDNIAINAIEDFKILQLSGISQGISESATDTVFAAIDIANQKDVKVAYDTNLRLKLWPLSRARAVIHEAVKYCQIVLPGMDDAIQLTGLNKAEDILDFYLKLGVDVIALTMGSEGVYVANQYKRSKIAPYQVKAIDATGAGDTFDGAFLAQIAKGMDEFKAAEYANAAAAIATQAYGAVKPMPYAVQVNEFMSERKDG